MAVEPQQSFLGDVAQWHLERRYRYCARGQQHVRLAEHVRVNHQGLPGYDLYLYGRRLGFDRGNELELCVVANGSGHEVSHFGEVTLLPERLRTNVHLAGISAHTVTLQYHAMWKVDVNTGVVSYPTTKKRYEAEDAVLSGAACMTIPTLSSKACRTLIRSK